MGSDGLIIRYDGSKWTRVTSAFPYQSVNKIRGVYSSAKDKLTLLVSDSNYSSTWGHRVQVFSYHHGLKKWFGPILLRKSVLNTVDQLNDIGGKDLSNLWMVGQVRVGGRNKAWAVTFK